MTETKHICICICVVMIITSKCKGLRSWWCISLMTNVWQIYDVWQTHGWLINQCIDWLMEQDMTLHTARMERDWIQKNKYWLQATNSELTWVKMISLSNKYKSVHVFLHLHWNKDHSRCKWCDLWKVKCYICNIDVFSDNKWWRLCLYDILITKNSHMNLSLRLCVSEFL
jgi:hypothetical protein